MRLGFIGAGNMAQAIIQGLIAQKALKPQEIAVSDVLPSLLNDLSSELGIHVYQDNLSLLSNVDIVVLAVKPIYVRSVLAEISAQLQTCALVSIVSGFSSDQVRKLLPSDAHILRIMPNTPLSVGEGATLLCKQHTLSDDEFSTVEKLFSAIGSVFVLEERLFDAATAISGCGPAFLYILQEAMADAGVMNGLPRSLACQLSAQTTIGAGKMIQASKKHPGELKDAVCSPGGSTIQGVAALERAGLRASIFDAVQAAYEAIVFQQK